MLVHSEREKKLSEEIGRYCQTFHKSYSNVTVKSKP